MVNPKIKEFYTLKKEISSYVTGKKMVKNIYLFNRKTRDLPPTAPYVCSALQDTKKPCPRQEIDIEYDGQSPDKEQREEQNYIMEVIKKRNEEYQYRCGIVHMKTGRGKSHMVMKMTSYFKTKTLILTHNIDTLNEMVDKFKKYTGYDVGVFYGKKKQIKDITISTHASFRDKLAHDPFNRFHLLIVDEMDANFSNKMIEAICVAKPVCMYGLTATPFRDLLDTQDLERFYGKMIYKKDQKNKGYNLLPSFHIVDYKKEGMEYPVDDYGKVKFHELREMFMEDQERINLQMQELKSFMIGRKVGMIFSDRIKECEIYLDRIQKNMDVETMLICGNVEKDDEEIKNKLKTGKQLIIVGTTDKIGRGVDIQPVDTIFFFAALKFQGTIIQSFGRALRHYPGKEDVRIFIWNDMKSQLLQKKQTIKQEYGDVPIKVVKFGYNQIEQRKAQVEIGY